MKPDEHRNHRNFNGVRPMMLPIRSTHVGERISNISFFQTKELTRYD